MKKSFLILGALGAIIATNGHAVQSGVIDVTLTCPAGCVLHTVQKGNSFIAYCWDDAHNRECADPKVNTKAVALPDDLIEQMKKTEKTVPARAAKVERNVKTATANTPSSPINTEPEIQDKVASGTVIIACPEGCKTDCQETAGGYMSCKCKKPNGELCQEEVLTIENTIHK